MRAERLITLLIAAAALAPSASTASIGLGCNGWHGRGVYIRDGVLFEEDPKVTQVAGKQVTDQDLFREPAPNLRRFAGVVADRDQDADDVLQEALARTLAVARLHDLDDAGAYLRTAIVRVVANHRRSAARRRANARAVRSDQTSEDRYPSDAFAILERLSAIDRALLVLVVLEGHSIETSAAVLGIGASTARSRFRRAKARLRKALNEEIDEEGMS